MAIQEHLLQMSSMNSVQQGFPRLGLSSLLTDYLLYNVSVDDWIPERDSDGLTLEYKDEDGKK